jgi:hypothetical protein
MCMLKYVSVCGHILCYMIHLRNRRSAITKILCVCETGAFSKRGKATVMFISACLTA